MTHTPGPWQQINLEDASGWVIVNYISEYSFIEICELSNVVTYSEQLANAHLIAAAPELLEACQALKADLDYLQNLWSKEGITDGNVDRLNTAIAKATGGQP